MQKLMALCLIIVFSLGLTTDMSVAKAQGNVQDVSIVAEDGLELVGWYAVPEGLEASESGIPAVILMHHSGGNKEKWAAFIPMLVEANYAVLAIDMRSFGRSIGSREQGATPDNWKSDAHQWVEWLRAQPGVDPGRINIVGASLGGDVGLNVMAEDESIVTLVAISSWLDAADVLTLDAVAQIDRPLYFVAGIKEEPAMLAMVEFMKVIQTDAKFEALDSSACCTFMITIYDWLGPSIISWLDEYNR